MRALTMGICLLAVCIAADARAERILAEFDWSDRDAGGELLVENPGGQPLNKTVLTIDAPGIDANTYALRGRVRYAGIEGQAFLEMWSFFPGGGRFFSRTLGMQGPMGAMSGDGDWRTIVVPFVNEPGGTPPERLVLNVVLPGAGRVWLGTFELVQFAPGEDPLAPAGETWFGRSTGGLVGAVGGTGLGLVCGLIGLLIGLGRGRAVAMGLLGVVLVAGVGALAVGLVAVAQAQPFQVTYPFLLLGGLGLVLAIVGLVLGRVRYRMLELARIRAKDLAA